MRFVSLIGKNLVICMLLALSLVASFGMASAHSHSNPSTANPPGRGRITVSPSRVIISSDGNAMVRFTLNGQGLIATHTYDLAASFYNACSVIAAFPSPSPTADLNGRFQVNVLGYGCEPGTYTVAAVGQSYPYDEYFTTIKFLSPRN